MLSLSLNGVSHREGVWNVSFCLFDSTTMLSLLTMATGSPYFYQMFAGVRSLIGFFFKKQKIL